LKALLFASLAVIALGGFVACVSKPKATSAVVQESLPLAPDVVSGKLANGMGYFIRPNAYPKGRAYLYLAVAAGSLEEDDSQRGLAHFLEHMAFNGTRNYPQNDLISYLQSLGMRFGPEINAFTAFDRTVFTLEVPSTDQEALSKALGVLNDWAFGISLDPAMVETERPVINEEWRLSQGAQERLLRKQLPLLLAGSRMAERLPIGEPDIFMKAPRSELERFYRDWYRPETMSVIAVGDFDPQAMKAKIEAAFAEKGSNNPARAKPDGSVPPPAKGRVLFSSETDPELPYAYLQLMYRLPDQAKPGTMEEYRASLIRNLIVGMENARLSAKASDPSVPFAYAGVSAEFLSTGRSALAWVVVPKEGKFAESLDYALSSKETMKKAGFGADELAAQKRQILSSLEQLKNDAEKNESALLADELVRHVMEDEPVPGIAWEFENVGKLFEGIGPEEVNGVVKAMFAAEDLTALFAAPDSRKAELPAREALDAALKKASQAQVAVRVEEKQKPLMATVPAAGEIVKEEALADVGLTKWTLSNGAIVYAKVTDFKNDEIAFNALSLGGTSTASDADFISAQMADGIASYSGLGNLTAPELERTMKGSSASVGRAIGPYTVGLGGGSSVKDLETLFQLINLHFTGNRLDPEAAKAYLAAVKTSLAGQDKDPQTVFSLTVSETMNGRNPRFMRLKPLDLATVEVPKAAAFLEKAYWAGDFVFSFSGNIDLKVMRSLVATYLASIPQNARGSAWKDLGVERPQGVDVAVKKGTDPKSFVYQAYFAPDEYSYAKFIRARTLKELLDIRLIAEIREKMGGVYSIGAQVGYQSIPYSELSLSVSFGCDPARAEELSAASDAELKKIMDGKFDPADFQKAKEIVKKAMETDFRRNDVWPATINQLLLVRKQALGVYLNYAGLIDALQPGDLSALAKTLDPEKRNRVILYPEK
jgi:zinc protease